MSSSSDKTINVESGTGGRRKRRSSRSSTEESVPTAPVPSGNEISPTKQNFFKFLSPKRGSLIDPRPFCPTQNLSSSSDKTINVEVDTGGRRRRRSSRSSTEESVPTTPVPSGNEKSPTKQNFFKFLSPKMPNLLTRKSSLYEKYSSPKSSTRPILSSQCSGKSFDADVSPIMNLKSVPTTFHEAPRTSVGDSRFDFGSLDEEKIIPSFFSSRTCYDAMPKSGKVIVLSTELLVKNAFSCLVTNADIDPTLSPPGRKCMGAHVIKIRAAPLWETSSQTFVGMLTISDFINVLRHYYYSSQDDIKDIENQKIVTWRKITSIIRPIIKISPCDSLVNATKLLIEERIHRLPVYDERRNSVLFVISRKRLLQYLYNNLMDKFGKTNLKVPSFWKKSLGELKSQIGTWGNIATVSINTKVIEALDLFCERQVSALPVMDEDNKLVDIFAKFDVFALAKEQTYDNLDMTVAEALDKAEVHEDVYGCTLDEPLGTVIDKFVAAKVHRLVVIGDKHAVIGMLSLSDILKFLVLQPLEDAAIASDTIDEAPEGAVGGQEDSTVFVSTGQESSGKFQKSSSLEKQDSSDLSEDLVKLQLEGGTPEPLSEASVCKDEP